nr:hypothetical protein [Comamonas testosteroni]
MNARPLLALTAILCASLLTGCLVPERFTARVDIQPDAGFAYRFDGSAIDPLAVMKIQQQGFLSDKEQQSLAAEAQKLKQNPDVKKAVYTGKARYQLEMEGQRKAGEALKLLNSFMVQTDANGVITVSAQPLKRKEKADLAQMGFTINGTLTVNVPAGAQVLSQNANTQPPSGSGAYVWRLGDVGVRPEIKLRFSP